MYKDILKDIRQRCVRAMNGITSTSMRQKGMDYKLNFGLAIPQIRTLAASYQPDKGLAGTLWKEETRELKILATLLYPVKDYTPEEADRWVAGIPNQEIREQLCVNLLQQLPFANSLATGWGSSQEPVIRTTGYWLLARLFISKRQTDVVSSGAFLYIYEDAISSDLFLRNAALSALKHIGRNSKKEADEILKKLIQYKDSPDLVRQESYNSLAFEFEYYSEG